MNDVMGFLAYRLDLCIFRSSPPDIVRTLYLAYIPLDSCSLRVHYWHKGADYLLRNYSFIITSQFLCTI